MSSLPSPLVPADVDLTDSSSLEDD
jgi:hypothetical protein